MSVVDLSVLVIAIAEVILGFGALCCARASRRPRLAAWGRRLFVLALLGLGGCGLVAASQRTDALAPLGLCAGLLVVGMVTDLPRAARMGRDS